MKTEKTRALKRIFVWNNKSHFEPFIACGEYKYTMYKSNIICKLKLNNIFKQAKCVLFIVNNRLLFHSLLLSLFNINIWDILHILRVIISILNCFIYEYCFLFCRWRWSWHGKERIFCHWTFRLAVNAHIQLATNLQRFLCNPLHSNSKYIILGPTTWHPQSNLCTVRCLKT